MQHHFSIPPAGRAKKYKKMQIKVFSVPLTGDEAVENELNRFLRTHRVLQVEQHLVQEAQFLGWAFCVRYLDGQAGKASTERKKGRVDYREILDAETFTRYNALREKRKQAAEGEGVPIYAVFTNEELAGLAKLEKLTAASMRSVPGVGAKKVERFGTYFYDHEASQ